MERIVMVHDLKIEQNYLENLISGDKKAEIRFNDRDYQRGDILKFTDYSKPQAEVHLFEVSHIHSGLGLSENYVALSLVPMQA